ncbi:AIPR family protein [Chitinibacter bivalviorum]|uniref:AIPR family protein n=1 Tax=Chitinibacter bivalviorum TaxID=2739434 RepID=A0A7H9BLK8_9NEIS|nr:AIPR family protein [Chitinibacter bivalviorum]QLG89570.1 AIPR family protein [Chitinibacter bivalviorum]
MFEKIKQDITQNYYQQHFPNDGQRFVAWYVRNIHGQDASQARYCITDGADDKQIDAIVIDDDSQAVYVVQGKFITTQPVDAAPLREVLSSWVQLKDLASLQENANTRLKQRLTDLSIALDDGYDIHFELITTGELTDAARHDLSIFQNELAASDDLPATLTLVNTEELQRRYELALEKENPFLKHELTLMPGKYMSMDMAGTAVIVAAIPLKDCLAFPGIKDGALFQKNVRQSLGLSNSVNKQIKSTIYGDKHRDFFFFHNGITAICSHMALQGDQLQLQGLSVVNGCQSLTTILSCSEKVKLLDDTFVMFRFYEIPQHDRADRISISTNSQSTVKPRDLRSNDKRVLALKKSFEQRYSDGQFLTKRGEQPFAAKNSARVVDLGNLGKRLMAWHSQRPNISYSETKIFDKYFEQLFKRDYTPERIAALQDWMTLVESGWSKNNPHGFNETLLAMRAYAPFHHLYAVSMCFAVASKHVDRVPAPDRAWQLAQEKGIAEWTVTVAATALNFALEAAANEPQPGGKVFSPVNWIKTKTCLSGITNAIQMQLMMMPNIPGGKEKRDALVMESDAFEYRWQAD